MTIHKAKGLQFDVVVLPDLDGKLIVDYASKEELGKYNPVLEKLEQQHKGAQ
jgi:ATP-dependent exoDNAse (exonuclease V) beta subunit